MDLISTAFHVHGQARKNVVILLVRRQYKLHWKLYSVYAPVKYTLLKKKKQQMGEKLFVNLLEIPSNSLVLQRAREGVEEPAAAWQSAQGNQEVTSCSATIRQSFLSSS